MCGKMKLSNSDMNFYIRNALFSILEYFNKGHKAETLGLAINGPKNHDEAVEVCDRLVSLGVLYRPYEILGAGEYNFSGKFDIDAVREHIEKDDYMLPLK